jgi:hypothetical protein
MHASRDRARVTLFLLLRGKVDKKVGVICLSLYLFSYSLLYLSCCLTCVRISLLTHPYHESSEENCRERGKLRSKGIKNVHVIEEEKRKNALHNNLSLLFRACVIYARLSTRLPFLRARSFKLVSI